MKFLILLPILFASFVLSDEDMRLTRSSDAGKTDPLMWMIVNQLQAFQTKLTSLDAKMSKLREKDKQINEKLIKVEKMTTSRKQIETFRKQFVAVETKLNAHSGKMSDLQNAVNRIKQGRLYLTKLFCVCTRKCNSYDLFTMADKITTTLENQQNNSVESIVKNN